MEPHARKDEIEDYDDDGLVQEIDPDGMAAEEKQGLEGFLPQEGQAAFLLFRIESLSEGDADEDDAEIGEDRPPVDAYPIRNGPNGPGSLLHTLDKPAKKAKKRLRLCGRGLVLVQLAVISAPASSRRMTSCPATLPIRAM